jgi:PPOX class probable FMN-dependent enzyme
MHNNPTVFSTEAELRELLGHPTELAARKAIPYLDKYCKAFIERAPFLTLATANAEGHVDVSPRGDQPGFVLILDDNTLFLPERPGNARYDSLINIVKNPRVGLLFFVPGFEDMLRVNGRAQLIHDEQLIARCTVRGKAPRLGIRVIVEEAYLHCAKAIKRSQLWSAEAQRDRSELPSLGKMILEQTAVADAPPSDELIRTVDEYIEDNYRTTLY